MTDEVDELVGNLKHQGDPIGLIDRRGDAYADFVHCAVSTPSAGLAEIETDTDLGWPFGVPIATRLEDLGPFPERNQVSLGLALHTVRRVFHSAFFMLGDTQDRRRGSRNSLPEVRRDSAR